MPEPMHVLIVAHQTAATPALLAAVRGRAQRGPSADFHLVVPQRPHGLDRLANPHDTGQEEALAVLAEALPKLSEAAGMEITGAIGDTEPLMAIHDALSLGTFDEIIISTLPLGVSRWLKLDLVSKTRALGLPVEHVLSGEPAETVAGAPR